VPLEEALDECFHGLQENLNSAHVSVREMCMMGDQGEGYEVSLRKVLQIHDFIDTMAELFKELKSVCTQVIGKPDKEEKDAMKKIVDDHKANKKREKDREREEDKLSKSLASSTLG
jgi:hypothetical protein